MLAGFDDEFAGIGDVVRPEAEEARPRGVAEGNVGDREAEHGTRGALVDVLPARAGASGEDEAQGGVGDSDARRDLDTGGDGVVCRSRGAGGFGVVATIGHDEHG